ncbi:MAG: helix-turn-helix domain-containing protein [Cytophagales bacterium]|nr:helix-turn-helix domain-containing protein [Rhizobacter sp.]
MPAEYLSVRSCSRLLDDVSEASIYAAVANGELPAARFGKLPEGDATDRRNIRIRRADLDQWFESKLAAA